VIRDCEATNFGRRWILSPGHEYSPPTIASSIHAVSFGHEFILTAISSTDLKVTDNQTNQAGIATPAGGNVTIERAVEVEGSRLLWRLQ
jgi:hypothetical protein